MTIDDNGIGRRMHTSVARTIRIANFLSEASAQIGLLFVSIFMLFEIVEIIGRRFFAFSILGLNEIGQLFVMGCISLVLPFVFIRESHIAVEFITDRLPPRRFALLKAIVALLCFLFVTFLTYFGVMQGWFQVVKGDVSPTLEIPIVWFWAPLLFGLAFSGLNCLILAGAHFLEAVLGLHADIAPNGTDLTDRLA